MAYVGYFKTEKIPGMKDNGWTWMQTYINLSPSRTTRKLATGSQHFIRDWPAPQLIYCHDDAAPEPVTDGHLRTVDYGGPDTEYSGPAGYIHSFTSSTGIFTADQDLSLQPQWTIYYNAKNTGVDEGYEGYINFRFYKRDASNTDTLLWTSGREGVGSSYSAIGLTLPLTPTGTVVTTDRLRIRIYMYQTFPS